MRRFGVFHWLGAASVAGMLSGCVLPPAVSIASLALDFASYVETGKTVTDHGISFVLQMDCGLLRVFDGPVCSEWPEQADVLLAAMVPMSDARIGGDPMRRPLDLAYLKVDAIRPRLADPGAWDDLRIARLEFADDRNSAAVPLGAVETVALVPGGNDALGSFGFLADDAEPAGVPPPWRRLSHAGYLADGILPGTATIAIFTIGS